MIKNLLRFLNNKNYDSKFIAHAAGGTDFDLTQIQSKLWKKVSIMVID